MRLTFAILFYTLAALTGASEEVDPTTADILKKLQDTGVLDNVKEELEKMLHEKNADLNELKEELNNARLKVKADETKEDAVDATAKFIKSYAAESGFKIKAEAVKAISKVVGDKDKMKHMKQLISVIDIVGKNSQLQEILQHETFNSFDELKDFANTQNNKIKSEKKAAEEKEDSKKAKDDLSANQIAQTIRMFTGMAKTNPTMLASTLFATLANYDIISKEVMKELMQYSDGFVKSEAFADGITYVGDSLAAMAESEMGSMMFQLIPLLMKENGREEAINKFKQGTKDKWSIFIESFKNSDTKMDFLMQCARKGNDFYHYIFKDEMKMMMANAFLISQQFPPLLPKNLFESIVDIVVKAFELFTTNDLDLKQLKEPVKKFVKDMEREYLSAEEYDKLDEDEQVRLVATFLDDNIVQLFFDLYQINDYVWFSDHAKCAKHLLCEFNEKISKEGSDIKKTITHGMTLSMAWLWGSSPEDFGDEFDLYEAANFGARENKDMACKQKFIHEDDECKYFSWQKYHTMNLSFDHIEL